MGLEAAHFTYEPCISHANLMQNQISVRSEIWHVATCSLVKRRLSWNISQASQFSSKCLFRSYLYTKQLWRNINWFDQCKSLGFGFFENFGRPWIAEFECKAIFLVMRYFTALLRQDWFPTLNALKSILHTPENRKTVTPPSTFQWTVYLETISLIVEVTSKDKFDSNEGRIFEIRAHRVRYLFPHVMDRLRNFQRLQGINQMMLNKNLDFRNTWPSNKFLFSSEIWAEWHAEN